MASFELKRKKLTYRVDVDDGDLERVKAHRWRIAVHGLRCLVISQDLIDERYQSLATFVLELERQHPIDYRDHNPLNCRRSNLATDNEEIRRLRRCRKRHGIVCGLPDPVRLGLQGVNG